MSRKASTVDFARPHFKGSSSKDFFEKFPCLLAGKDLRDAANTIIKARQNGKHVILGIGGHVIKVGLGPVIIDLIKRQIVTGISMNGAAMIHDVEIATYGETSENVDKSIKDGTFGLNSRANLISTQINHEIASSSHTGMGLGEAIGKFLRKKHDTVRGDYSILRAACQYNIPATVHVAFGTDINHMHGSFDPEAAGKATHKDFEFFCQLISEIEGGVYLNVGSAVIMPEVFLKAVSLGRNRGHKVTNFTTIVLDFLKQYRPMKNVCERPTEKGIYLVGHHEIMFPLLAAMVIEGS